MDPIPSGLGYGGQTINGTNRSSCRTKLHRCDEYAKCWKVRSAKTEHANIMYRHVKCHFFSKNCSAKYHPSHGDHHDFSGSDYVFVDEVSSMSEMVRYILSVELFITNQPTFEFFFAKAEHCLEKAPPLFP